MKRGLQRTSKVIAIVVMVVAVPIAAFAAGGNFSRTSGIAPALYGVSASGSSGAIGVEGRESANGSTTRLGVFGTADGAGGIGVLGRGARYGVLSHGDLGIASGKSLKCSGCVGVADLSSAARGIQPLPSGHSESGLFGAGGANSSGAFGYLSTGINYQRPLAKAIANDHVIDVGGTGPIANCSGPGQAARGYLCIYSTIYNGVQVGNVFSTSLGSPSIGVILVWYVLANQPLVAGEWTVTAK